MSLHAVLHLKHVFRSAKKFVRGGKLGKLCIANVLAVRKPSEADERVRAAKPTVAAAVSELQSLGEKLDLTNAAAAQLHVVAQHLDRAAAAMGVDLERGVLRLSMVHYTSPEDVARLIGALDQVL